MLWRVSTVMLASCKRVNVTTHARAWQGMWPTQTTYSSSNSAVVVLTRFLTEG